MSSGTESVVTDVVRTKLRVPRPPRGLISRTRLLDPLRDRDVSVILVCAPAGFGKSVLILDWLREEGLPAAWLSLDPLDNDPRRFFAHLAEAVEGLGIRGSEALAEGIRDGSGFSGGVPSDELLEHLGELEGRAIIVLDDVHHIDAGSVLAPLSQLVTHAGPGPLIVLLTRRDPPFPLSRLRLEGRLLELREEDLRFTPDEADALFQTLLPRELERDLIDRLGTRTEGWIAGLRMAALVLERAESPRAMVDAFTGSHRFLVEYLLEEVLGGQEERVQRFLLDTSILPRFTGEACVAVLDDESARQTLLEVEEANLFVVPLGGPPPWYRYHHLFAELLQFRLERLAPGRRQLLHERASHWFEDEGDLFEALEQAAAMSSKARLVELLDRHGMAIVARSELGVLRRWLAQVPDPLAQPFPFFLQIVGWSRLLAERAPDLAPVLEAGYRAVDTPPPEYQEEDRERARIGLDTLCAYAARYAGRLDEALSVGRRVLDEIPASDAHARGLILYNQARVHMVLGEMEPASVLLEESFEQSLRVGMTYLVLNGFVQRGAVLAQTHGLNRAREVLAAAVEHAAHRGVQRVPAFGGILYQLGQMHLLADELEEAAVHFERAAAHGGAGGFHEARYDGLLGLARVRTLQRRFDEAHDLLAETEVFLHAHQESVFASDTTLELERLRLALFLEERGLGPPVVFPGASGASGATGATGAGEPGPGERWTVRLETELLLRLQAALGSEQTREEARALAQRLHAESAPRGRGIAASVALLASAVLAEGAAAWSLLNEALEMAAARGYVRPLLELGEPVRGLLQAALSRPARYLQPSARAHARLLLDRFRAMDRLDGSDGSPHAGGVAAPVSASGPGSTSGFQPLHELLTDRELEVLVALARGGANKSIARALHVSTETVRTHLKHIYAKLGVSGRRDAVVRARQLGLVPSPPGS